MGASCFALCVDQEEVWINGPGFTLWLRWYNFIELIFQLVTFVMPIHSDIKPTLLTLQRFNDSKKRRALLICLLLATLVLLTLGLQNISLQAPTPVNFEQQNDDTSPYLAALREDRAFIVVAFVLLIVLLLLFISRIDRKWGIILLVSTVLISFAFYLSSSETIKEVALPAQNVSTPVVEEADSPPVQPAAEYETVEFQPPQFSNLFLLFISLAVILFIAFIVWMLFLWQRMQPPVMHIQPLEEIGEVVRSALNELEKGTDGRDAVIQCYVSMNEIVMRSHRVERGASRTASEFVARLEKLGLPGEATRKLTHLFESVRYGANSSQPLEVEEAKACLAEIVKYCGEPA